MALIAPSQSFQGVFAVDMSFWIEVGFWAGFGAGFGVGFVVVVEMIVAVDRLVALEAEAVIVAVGKLQR